MATADVQGSTLSRWLDRARRAAIRIVRGGPFRILALTVLVALPGAFAFWQVEPKHTFFKSVWWALVTMTTVGYGDISPDSNAGRVVAIILMFGGVTILALISASIASYLVERRLKAGKGLSHVKMKEHIVLAGWASQGEVVLHNLNAASATTGRDVVLINELGEDVLESLSGKYRNLHLSYVHGDATQDFVLQRANAKHASVAIVLAGRYSDADNDDAVDNRTLKVVMGLRSYSPDLKIFAEVRSVQNEPHIRRAGADNIVSPFEMGANLLANAPLSPGLPIMLKELLAFDGNGFRTVEIPSRFVDEPVKELHAYFREQDAILVGLVTEVRSGQLDELLEDSDDNFIDAFVASQFSQAVTEEERSRFAVRVNPPDHERVLPGERATVIMRQAGGQG